jgi:hypothetical protein
MRMSAAFSRLAVWLMGAMLAIGCTTTPVATPDELNINGGEGPGADTGDEGGATQDHGDDLHQEDMDDDGIPNAEDNCPATPNEDQDDLDQDGVGDVCDDCPTVSDPEQEDANDDNEGDACEDLPPPPPDTPPSPPPPPPPEDPNQPLCDNGDDLCREGE